MRKDPKEALHRTATSLLEGNCQLDYVGFYWLGSLQSAASRKDCSLANESSIKSRYIWVGRMTVFVSEGERETKAI